MRYEAIFNYINEKRICLNPFSLNQNHDLQLCPERLGTVQWSVMADQPEPALFLPAGHHYGGDGRTTFALPDLRGANGSAQGTASFWANVPVRRVTP